MKWWMLWAALAGCGSPCAAGFGMADGVCVPVDLRSAWEGLEMYEGSLVIRSEAEADAFCDAGYQGVDGSLEFHGGGVDGSVTTPCVQVVTGDVRVIETSWYQPGLESLWLVGGDYVLERNDGMVRVEPGGLVHVRGKVAIRYHEIVQSIRFDELRFEGGLLLHHVPLLRELVIESPGRVHGPLELVGLLSTQDIRVETEWDATNVLLDVLPGVDGVDLRGVLSVEDTLELGMIGTSTGLYLPNIRGSVGAIVIHRGNPSRVDAVETQWYSMDRRSISELDLPAVSGRVGSIEIYGAEDLLTLRLGSLGRVGDVRVQGASSLHFLKLGSLHTVEGDFRLDTGGLITLDLGLVETVGGDLSLRESFLENLQAFTALESVEGDLELWNNPWLTDFTALEGLVKIGGDLRLTWPSTAERAVLDDFVVQTQPVVQGEIVIGRSVAPDETH